MRARALAGWAAVGGLVCGATGALATGSGGTAMVGGEPVRTGPVPVWLVELLYSPPAWAAPAVGALFIAVAAVAGVAVARGGAGPEAYRESLSNGITVACPAGLALAAAAAAPPLPAWAVVVAALPGAPAAMWLNSWLGLRGDAADS
jgi:hypothetical protein